MSAWWAKITAAELLELRRRLVGHLRRQFRNLPESELEDLVHYAFIRLFRRRGTVSAERDGLFRYLRTVASRAGVDRIRRIRRRSELLPEAARERDRELETGGQDASTVESAEIHQKIWQIFCALDEVERLIIWSHVVEGRSLRAIARDLDLNWHRVAEVVDKALRRARRELGPD